jgi:hypothetical protein
VTSRGALLCSRSIVTFGQWAFFLIRLVWGGVQQGPFGTATTDWPIVDCPGWLWWWIVWWNEDWQWKPKYSEKTHPNATLSTTNPTWPDPGSNPGWNPGRRGGKPATNRLSYGAANGRGLTNQILILQSAIAINPPNLVGRSCGRCLWSRCCRRVGP